MPRAKNHSRTSLIDDAMHCFWTNGYEATSITTLVEATGVSRHGIYQLFDGKHDLFLTCLDTYQKTIVSPAFKAVEAKTADCTAIRNYFEHQISLAEKIGLPGPGCLVANTMTEIAPHDPKIAECVLHHNDRLQRGFQNALTNTSPSKAPKKKINQLAEYITINAQGLWSYSRSQSSAQPLRRYAAWLVGSVEEALAQ